MIDETKILTSIDVGTTKVCAIIGRHSKSKGLEILGFGVVPCDGVSKGNVANVAATQNAVRASVRLAEQMAKTKVQSAFVGVTGSHVTFQNRMDMLNWVGKRGVITADDLGRVPEAVANDSAEPGRKVIHAIPRKYYLDGKEAVRDPLGMHTNHIQVETHLVTGAAAFISKLTDAVEGSGIHVEDLVLEPLASGEAVLTQRERDKGAALIDIGGGTTDIVLYKQGSAFFTGVIPVGGFQFTNDICICFNTPYQSAEEAKLKHATADLESVKLAEEITLPVMGRTTGLKVSRLDLCQLTKERAQELARLIGVKLKEANVKDFSELQLVVTGGASNLPGLIPIMKRTLTDNIRIGVPSSEVNLPPALVDPAYSTAVGILLWAVKNPTRVSQNGHPNGNGHAPANGNGHAVVPLTEQRGGMFRFIKQVKSIF